MKKVKISLLVFIILINSVLLTGCWNYREIDDYLIVAGVAVDIGINNEYIITAEVAQISGGKDPKINSKMVTGEGKTAFDAVRNMISSSGKKLYWAHAKVLILSKKVAEDGVLKILDFYTRDSETREDVCLLVSEEDSAKEIFNYETVAENIKSYALYDILKDQVNLSKTPLTDILEFQNDSYIQGMSSTIPAVRLRTIAGKTEAQVMGCAIIKEDKLAGFLNGDESKSLNFILNRIKGGVLLDEVQTDYGPASVSLEIFGNKTSVKPSVDGNTITIDLNIEVTVAIDEVVSKDIQINDQEQKDLKKNAEKDLKAQIQTLIHKMQSEYDADIFGFGEKLREENAQTWKKIDGGWAERFKELKVNVETHVNIKNSAVLS